MTKSSCIQHPPSTTIVMIREDYLALCQHAPDPHCAAALLNNMEYWTNIKLANHRQVEIENAIAANEGAPLIPDDGTWVYKTHEETQCDLLELFGRNKIVNNMAWLVSAGYLDTRANPRYKWDKTKQYSLNIETLQDAILNLPSFKTKRSNHAKLNDGKGKSKRAIPESTTETTTEENKKSISPNGADTSDIPAKDIAAFIDTWLKVQDAIKPNAFKIAHNRDLAEAMIKKGITPDDVAGYIRWRRSDDFWDKFLSLDHISENVMSWKKQTTPTPPPAATYVYEEPEDLITPEQQQQLDDLIQGLVDKQNARLRKW